MKTRLVLSLTALLLCSGAALAQQSATPPVAPASTPASTLPEWDKLSPQQRDTLIAPLRDRWNSDPRARARMLEHGQRWQNMTPEQRAQARKGMKRFEDMNPEQRERARALFSQMRDMSPEQREQLREQWKKMTPEQRKSWMDTHRPKDMPPPER